MAVDRRAARMGMLAMVGLVLISILGARLWFLQVVDRQQYQDRLTASKIRVVDIPPERGRVFDADGRVLAGNERILILTVERNVIRSKANRALLFERLSGPLKMPVIDLQKRYNPCFGTPQENDCRLGQYDPLLPFPLKEDVNEEEVAFIKQRSEDYPGVEVVEGWRRVYPYAPLASHVVGYMGSISSDRQREYLAQGYNLNERVGQFGVELSMEAQLHGQWGRKVFEIDSNGRIVRELAGGKDAVAGNDIQLTIDLDIQQYAEQALETKLKQRRNLPTDMAIADRAAHNPIDREEFKINSRTTKRAYRSSKEYGTQEWIQYKAPAGAVVVQNHSNGQIVAMASYPTFDNRWMSSGVSGNKFEQIFPSEGPPGPDGKPTKADPDVATLVNRAVQARYNLGSTIKPFIAWAGLHSGIITPEYTFFDEGTWTLETIDRSDCIDQGGLAKCVFKNALDGNGVPSQYGPVRVVEALAVSSDAFFYRIGEKFWKLDEDANVRDDRGCTRSTLKDDLEEFGFGSDTGVQLPYEWDGRVPDDCIKQQLIESGALAKNEVPRLVVGDNVQVAIGQGLMAATPLQLANAYSTLANGGVRMQPTVIKAILAPFTPDGAPGFADMTKAIVIRSFDRPVVQAQLAMEGVLGPIDTGLRRVITGPGVFYPKGRERRTTGQTLFEGWRVLDIAGKTGTAQGAGSYPWNDSSVFGAYSRDAEHPYTVVAYLEKSGFGGKAAAPVAKCLFEVLKDPTRADPVVISDPLDINSTVAAPAKQLADIACLEFKGNVGRN
jgi:penicillin-binding protein 2